MNWKDFFATYGAYITILLGIIGYFIKRVYDLKSKKIEVSYTFFQQNKINAITKFFDSYAKAERMWHHFPIYRVLNKDIDANGLDKMIWPLMNEINMSINELTLYLEQEELNKFNNINDKLLEINNAVLDMFSFDTDENRIQSGNKFHGIQRKALKECQSLLKEIGNNTRKNFIGQKAI
jgi:hypothetical protein